MLATLRKRFDREDEGFTLIELMVVVLIIAILLAIAIPTFLGARERANDRAAQSSLRNALTAAKTIYTDSQDYTDADDATLQDVEPSLQFSAGTPSTDFKEVDVDSSVATEWGAAAKSESGKCFYIHEVGTLDAAASGQEPGTYFGKDTDDNATCDGATAMGAAGEDFNDSAGEL